MKIRIPKNVILASRSWARAVSEGFNNCGFYKHIKVKDLFLIQEFNSILNKGFYSCDTPVFLNLREIKKCINLLHRIRVSVCFYLIYVDVVPKKINDYFVVNISKKI